MVKPSKSHSSSINIIDYLPHDCLYRIFGKLNETQDQCSFGLTCHTFLDIQNSSLQCFKLEFPVRINVDDHINVDDRINVDRLLNRFWRLESLFVKVHRYSTDLDLSGLQNAGSKLCSLNLSGCQNITNTGLTFLASVCPLLSVVDLFRCDITDNGLKTLAEYCKLLKEVNLGRCSTDYFQITDTDTGLTILASVCPLLSVANLSGCSITDNGLKTLAQSCKLLKEVNIMSCHRVSDLGILSLTQSGRQLESLDITGCFNFVGQKFKGCSRTLARITAINCEFNSAGLTGILSGRGVEYLDLSDTFHYKISGLEAFDLGFGANIKILNFESCVFVNDDAVIKISKGCPLLQEWNLSYCYEILVYGWESIGLYCKNLETLFANHCNKLCDAGLLALANGCITYLDALGLNEITPDGFRAAKELRETKESRKHMVIFYGNEYENWTCVTV